MIILIILSLIILFYIIRKKKNTYILSSTESDNLNLYFKNAKKSLESSRKTTNLTQKSIDLYNSIANLYVLEILNKKDNKIQDLENNILKELRYLSYFNMSRYDPINEVMNRLDKNKLLLV